MSGRFPWDAEVLTRPFAAVPPARIFLFENSVLRYQVLEKPASRRTLRPGKGTLCVVAAVFDLGQNTKGLRGRYLPGLSGGSCRKAKDRNQVTGKTR